ncbi:lytic transglycosylase domain-containing protein [Streptomyces cucumeris]|uniref:lytic transglycosylase domain-containing protein n=1 Tax=Streptomyces cucumeris TaxID=2962890 RepID=UPI003EBC095A
MASSLHRATQGLAAVAVATTLVTVGFAAQKGGRSAAQDAPVEAGSQAVPRPFVTPRVDETPAPGTPDPKAGERTRPPSSELTLPTLVYRAYLNAQTRVARSRPDCHLTWPVLAGIGRIESDHARGGALTATGDTVSPIVGPALNGSGFAAIRDTDDGRYDGDTRWDRAVGPMQFIPSSWAMWGSDGNDDDTANPHNMYDAALTAGRYLCADGRDLAEPAQLRSAILSYNNSAEYATTVMRWIDAYAGVDEPRLRPGPSPSPSPTPSTSPSTTPTPRPSPTASRSTEPSETPGGPHSPSPTPTPSPSASASGNTDITAHGNG